MCYDVYLYFSSSQESYFFEDQYSGPGTKSIVVKAEMTPLSIKTMSKFSDRVSSVTSMHWWNLTYPACGLLDV